VPSNETFVHRADGWAADSPLGIELTAEGPVTPPEGPLHAAAESTNADHST